MFDFNPDIIYLFIIISFISFCVAGTFPTAEVAPPLMNLGVNFPITADPPRATTLADFVITLICNIFPINFAPTITGLATQLIGTNHIARLIPTIAGSQVQLPSSILPSIIVAESEEMGAQ